MPNIQDIIDFIVPNQYIGKNNCSVNNIVPASAEIINDDDILWLSTKNIDSISNIHQGTIICSSFDTSLIKADCNYIIVENPRQAFQKVLANFFVKKKQPSITRSASIDVTAVIGNNIFIGANVVIEEDCVIGDNCSINHNTVIMEGTKIGNNVIIGCNNTIGGIGYGYEKNEQNEFELIPHIGNVVLEDDVEIGNNTCIDRAVLGSTILRKNVKVDNLVHIAHGVDIGENSMIIANAMVAGSVKIGKNTWVAPSVSILNQKKIGDNVTVGLSAVVLKDVEDGMTVMGNPAEDFKEAIRKKRILEEKLFKKD